MAEAKHFKVSRKELREPDEFQAFTAQVAEWARENQSALVGALSALLAVAAIATGVSWYSARQASAASVRFEAAQSLLDAKKFADAATEFASIATTYPRTATGRLAGLYRARALALQPDATAAATAYAEYLATSPPTDYLKQQALIGLATAQEAAKNIPAALEAYQQAIEVGGPFRTQAQLALARLEETAGDTDKAKSIYLQLLKASDLDADARQTIASKLPPGEASNDTAPPSGE